MKINFPKFDPEDTVMLCVTWNDEFESDVWSIYLVQQGNVAPVKKIEKFKGLPDFCIPENGFSFFLAYVIPPKNEKLSIDNIEIEPINKRLSPNLQELFYKQLLYTTWNYFVDEEVLYED